MSDTDNDERKSSAEKPLSLKPRGTSDAGRVKQSFSHGRSRSVVVEKKRKRVLVKNLTEPGTEAVAPVTSSTPKAESIVAPQAKPTPERAKIASERKPTDRRFSGRSSYSNSRGKNSTDNTRSGGSSSSRGNVHKTLSEEEYNRRVKALEIAKRDEGMRQKREEEETKQREIERDRLRQEAETKAREQEEAAQKLKVAAEQSNKENTAIATPSDKNPRQASTTNKPNKPAKEFTDNSLKASDRPSEKKNTDEDARKAALARARTDERRRSGKLTITQALNQSGDDTGRQRSLASIKRRQEREKKKQMSQKTEHEKVVRDVRIPDAITVQELANRMAERAGDVIKVLMKQGMMATINDTLDADTAELIVGEFNHNVMRVSESDVENVLEGAEDTEAQLLPRAPVVTVMGHVDHGKTSLLDSLRKTNVVSGEAGGITQHIGAYQVETSNGKLVTFLDTPGHAAFTSMRSRGAHVTDIVILVVAADDSVMPQTIEAINHAKAAKVPMIVAINKIDKPSADANRVRQQLLQHEVFVESMGGDILEVEVSALKGTGLEQLVENITLQAELLDITANPERAADGAVIEAKLDVGRGPVATVLVQRGTLNKGDIFVVGSQWGRVRALINDKGKQVKKAGPSIPVEVLGLQGTPEAGDTLSVVETEAKAREIADYRQRQIKAKQAAAGSRTTLDQLLAQSKADADVQELPIVVKGDVQGSVEAIVQAMEKIGNEEVRVRILHSGVGAITESDVSLAEASSAPIIGFNVRANAPARESSNQKGIEIRYYSIIYDLVDDIRKAASGLLSPEIKETFIGHAKILQTFRVTGVGMVAGCRITDGIARRSAGVRLLRDNIVIHEGTLKTLKRFKDEVKEVQSGQECGMAFEKYDDIRPDDVIEIFETKEIERTL